MTSTAITTLSGTAQGKLIERGDISSVELMNEHFETIERVNPALNAVVEVLRDRALKEAALADARRARGERRSALDGVPFSVKDSIEVEGTLCSAGTLGSKNWKRSERDATLVARLRGAGAIPLARTNLPDLLFAFESDNLLFGRTNNPYDPSRTSGGSSGGEAALIAACGSPFGLGSDCAGSVRLPAHYCGIASLKPTSGRLPRTGHVPPAGGWIEALWQIGPMARQVEDLCAMFPLLAGADGADHTVVDMPFRNPADVSAVGLRVGFFTDNGIAPVDPSTFATVHAAVGALERMGARVNEVQLPNLAQTFDLEMAMIGPDGGHGLRAYATEIGSTPTHPLFDAWLAKLAVYRTGVDGFAAFWSRLDAFRQSMFAELANFDVLISPVSTSAAVAHGRSVEDAIFRGYSYTMTYNLTGWPAGVVRFGTSPEGLPIGVQIAAAPWREDLVLAAALMLEQHGGWRPPALAMAR